MDKKSLFRRKLAQLAYPAVATVAAVSALLAMPWPVAAQGLAAAVAPARGPSPDLQATGPALAAARCAACHGADGNTADPASPKLAGQIEGFLALQLRNYRSGERPHPVMVAVVRPLSDREILALSRHYAALPPMRHDGHADPALLQRGEAVYGVGKPGAPACRHCHGPAGEGLAPVFARLAGQHPAFVEASLQPYRRESTFGNPYAHVMKAVVQAWTDEDIRAVAAYVGSLR